MTILYKDNEKDGLYDGYNENKAKKIGEKGEKLVSDFILNSFSDDYLLLNSVYVRTEDGDFTEIDHILLHEQFILCIETKNFYGELEAIDEETWGMTNWKGEYIKLDSPQQQSIHHAYSLKSYLTGIGIPIKIFAVVVLSNKDSSFNYRSDKFYTSQCPVISKQKLTNLIPIIAKKTQYEGRYDTKDIAEQILDEHNGIKSSKLFWYKKMAMNEDDREAQYQLGKMYLYGYYEGEGKLIKIKKNEKAAIRWLTIASKKGHSLAKKELYLYYNS